MKINTIIFDCFGVILDPVLGGWYRDNMLKRGLVDENLPDTFRQFDTGELTEDDMLNYFRKYDGVTSTPEKLREEIDAYLKIDNSLVEVIKKLKQKGFKIVLLSNANNSFFERKVYPTYPEFKSLFDEIIISSIVQMVKPDQDIYLHALEKAGSHPKETLFIDDSRLNVDTAIRLGMHGFVYTESTAFVKYLESLRIDLD